jgi:SAM-dependent methyltransferase
MVMPRRWPRYPVRFVARHPIRTARNVVGNRSSALADRYLGGLHGIEIGGASHNDFFLNTINVDVTDEPSTVPAQIKYAGRAMTVDVVARADALPFAQGSHDFVLASHVLEHVPDPIAALREWHRVARRYVYIILPQPTNVFDADRPLTTLHELVVRHEERFDDPRDQHWSVWSPASFQALCRHLGLHVLDVQDPDDKRGNGFAVILDSLVTRP